MGTVVITVLMLGTPIPTSLFYAAEKNMDFWSVLRIREQCNLVGMVAGIAALYVITRTRRFAGSRWPESIIAATLITGVAMGGRQIARGLLDVNTEVLGSSLWLAEISGGLFLLTSLTACLILTAEREQLTNAQTVLLDEARRALQDDHESLRNRVFDHLHGTVQSGLVVARARLLDIAREIPDEDQAARIREVAGSIQNLHHLEIRRLAHVIVASGLDTSLHEGLAQLASSSEGLCDVTVTVDRAFDEFDMETAGDDRASLRLAIYRIVEECISNAIRHGQAKNINVDLSAGLVGRRSFVDIVVTNDGHLDNANDPEGVGLRVIRARAAAFNGHVRTSTVNGRYRVDVRLELPN
jgi:signal transduction histidine kinase